MEEFHIHPINDLKEHLLKGNTCPCNPRTEVDENGVYVIHNSWDGREIIEELIEKAQEQNKTN